jgi:3-oxoacyl-[acyl-carrier protein] reductase
VSVVPEIATEPASGHPGGAPVVMVTGGSRGLGSLLVERFLADGWRVATCSRSGGEFVEKISHEHPENFFHSSVDATEARSVRAFAAACATRFGQLDALVNNAGLLHTELLLTMSPHRMERVLATNLLAPVLFTQACAKVMVPRRRGVIVNVSSVSGRRGYRGVAVYAAAKAGLEGFTRSAARELGAFNIRVNSIVPGFFDSDMTSVVGDHNRDRILRRTPLQRLGTAQEMADAVLFLTSPHAQFVSGHSLVVDGGITC